jgi:hypothetical protein
MHDLFSHGGGGGNKAPFATSEIREAKQPEARSKRSKDIAIPNTRPSSGITNHDPDAASSDRSIPAAALADVLSVQSLL